MSSDVPLTPLRFRPLFKPAIWGGARLRPWLGAPVSDEPTGEAGVLSDQGSNHSEIIEGSAAGLTLRQLLEQSPERVLGRTRALDGRFPLLLKFIDARAALSVQVHPDDARARKFEPQGPGIGKTEAWLVLEAEPGAKLYSGLAAGVTTADVRAGISTGVLEPLMHSFEPIAGDCLFLRAGVVHAIGAGCVLFEIQQSSDITYRLFDWNRVDPKTGKSRELHIEKGLACVDDAAGPCVPVIPVPKPGRENLAECEFFFLDRITTDQPFAVGVAGECRMVVGLEGSADLVWRDQRFVIRPGDVWMIPAETGECDVKPNDRAVILECGAA